MKKNILASLFVMASAIIIGHSPAIAEPGGTASSIAARFEGGVLQGISTSTATGQTSAFAAARISADGSLETFAFGTSAAFNFQDFDSGTVLGEINPGVTTTSSNEIDALAIGTDAFGIDM